VISGKLGLARRIPLALLAAFALALVCLAPAALAGTTYPYTGQSFGPGGIGAGAFGNVAGVAVDQGSGDVFVYDGGAGKVYKFDAAGHPVNFSALGTNVITGVGSSGGSEVEIAVDGSSGPDAGDIYVANNFEVRIYGADGSLLGELTGGEFCGVAVDSAGAVYVGSYPETVKKFTPTSNPVTNSDETASMEGLHEVCNVAVDGSGNVYAATYSGGVTRYEASQFGSSAATGTQLDEHGRTLAVDTSSEHVFLDEESSVAEFDSTGSPLGTSGAGNLAQSFGVAAKGDDLYAGVGGVVEIFGPPTQVGASIDSTTAATALSGPAVTLQAQVNPQGLATTYHFEYGPTTSYDTSVPVPDGEIGASFADQTVSQEIHVLAQNTIYHYRVVISDSLGTVDGPDETFFTAGVELAPPTSFSPASALPDGRVYEEVSPANKHGWEAGAELSGNQTSFRLGIASADGDSIGYEGAGPGADVNTSGVNTIFVGQRSASGWSSRAAMPRGTNLEETNAIIADGALTMDFSADLSHLAYYVKEPNVPGALNELSNLYLEGPDPFATPLWLARPTIPVREEHKAYFMTILGGAPDLSNVYFTYNGFLLPEDVEVAKDAETRGPGLYEYSEGAVHEASVLPDGKISPFGAVPISGASPIGVVERPSLPDAADNQVSEDGKTMFFVSPAKGASPQLYARTTAADGSRRTVLVSASALPGHVGEQALHGVSKFANTAPEAINKFGTGGTEGTKLTYGYASPDGSHIVFVSGDRLTSDAPSDATPKTYDFDVETGSLEYLPGIPPGSGIVTSAHDGSWFVFENASSTPVELDRWSQGPDGGSVSPIVQLPAGNVCDGLACVGPARIVDDGSVFVFTTEAPIAGFNDAGGFRQVFRYDFDSGKLSCVSCAPAGVKPSGDAFFSGIDEYLDDQDTAGGSTTTNEARGVSADGNRIFFDSPDPLVPRDTNGKRDVYEWEDGVVYLISSGSSPDESLLLDNSESGGDVFFTTTSELVKGDDDLAYDVYDARVPRPGDTPPPSSVPCQGDVCQGAPSVPSLLTTPASAAFNGLGNLAPQAPAAKPTVVAKKKTPPKKKKKKKKRKHKQKRGSKSNRARKSNDDKKSNHGKRSR
jgi:hypothetical protein